MGGEVYDPSAPKKPSDDTVVLPDPSERVLIVQADHPSAAAQTTAPQEAHTAGENKQSNSSSSSCFASCAGGGGGKKNKKKNKKNKKQQPDTLAKTSVQEQPKAVNVISVTTAPPIDMGNLDRPADQQPLETTQPPTETQTTP